MKTVETDLVVIGGGPGGYAAAFRAKDLGIDTLLIEKDKLGGVCLNEGCIPSKYYLSLAEKIFDAEDLAEFGVSFSKPTIQEKDVLEKKNKIVQSLSQGIGMLAKKRGVEVLLGEAFFEDEYTLEIKGENACKVKFKHAIIAAGSRPNRLPFLPEDDRIFDSTGALELSDIKGSLVIIGGGIIGCEMATIYRALGAEVTILEAMDSIMMGADPKQVKICQQEMEKRGIVIKTGVKINQVDAKDKLNVVLEDEQIECEQILYSVGRIPNGDQLSLDQAGVSVDERGFVKVDSQMRTNKNHIYAIGDIAKTDFDNQMLAHRSTAHGHLAAEIIKGHNLQYDIRVIPAVAYTDPEIAWVGIGESEAKERGCKVGRFPWAASGRSLAMGQGIGETKVYADLETERILGASIVGRQAGDLIGIFALSIEMGATLTDLALTVMPHPTLVETASLACEVALGTVTDL